MQPVHTCRRFGEPSTTTRTRWMFGFHRRFVRRCEWLTFMPKLGCFPQISQTAAMTGYLECIGRGPSAAAQDPERVLAGPSARQPRVVGRHKGSSSVAAMTLTCLGAEDLRAVVV